MIQFYVMHGEHIREKYRQEKPKNLELNLCYLELNKTDLYLDEFAEH
jgi:hypothetical protein